MEFRILGPLEVTSDGQALDLGGAKQRTLLTMLLIHRNQVVSQDRLIDALWEESPPDTAQKALQVHISKLRTTLGKDRIATKASGYAIRVEEDELDVERFERLAEEGGPRLAEALALWRGPPLADVANTRFARQEIGRLEERRLAVLEERIEAELALGRGTDLIAELESLVAGHPLRERFRALLMLALYRDGRQAQALEVYQDARRILVDELGIEPGRELRELHRTILRQDPALEPRIDPATMDRRAEAQPGFVGRGPELTELARGLEDVFAGRGRLFLLQGEPGIGKSRLAEEVANRAAERGAHVLVGRCWEAGGAPAYWPWTQSLRAYVRAVEPIEVRRRLGASAADVAQIVPQLHELFPDLPQHEAADSEAARFRLFDSTAAFMASAAADRPLVLVLDDLHAADESSLLLLRYVASSLEDSRILVVGTFRDLDPTVQETLETALAELGRLPVTYRIRLSGLDRNEVGQLAELTGSTTPTEQLVAELYAETEGNPLFVSEIVRLLAAEGRLGEEARGRIPIPESIREAIGRRLRTLSGECRRVLSLGSVFGREFGLVALERTADYTGIDRLLSVLDEAVASRVVEELPGSFGRLRFGHALTRDTLYEEIPATHRARLHLRAAEVLEALYAGNPEPHLAELAHHFSLAVPAGSPERAIEYARRAGDRALSLPAHEEAARLYELALAVAERSAVHDDSQRCELLLSLGEAEAAADRPAAKRAFVAAAEVARRVASPRHLAEAAVGYGGRIMYARAGGDGLLVPLLEEGLSVLGDEDVALRARLLARLAGALRDEPSRERRDRLSLEAVELARRAADPVALAYALDGRAAAIMAPDTVRECLALGAELRDLGVRMGNPERVVQGHWHQIITRYMTGAVAEAEEELEAMSRLVHELGQPVQLWQVTAARAMFVLASGRLDEAEELLARAFELGERAQPEMAIGVFRLQELTLRDLRGGLADVEPALAALVADWPARPVFRCARAYLDAQLGRREDAKRTLDELSRSEAAALPFDMEWLFGMALLAETCAVLDDTESAPVLYRLLRPWEGFIAVDHPEAARGSVSRYLGLLAAAMERWPDAERHFADGLTLNESAGLRPWLARTREDWSRMLLARGGPGDIERARQLLGQALEGYRQLGMEPHAARAATLERTTPAR